MLISHVCGFTIYSVIQSWCQMQSLDSKQNTVKCRYDLWWWCGPIYRDFTHSTAMTAAEHESDLKLTTDTPYLTLTHELWDVCCEEIAENRPHYNGTALYWGLVKMASHLANNPWEKNWPLWLRTVSSQWPKWSQPAVTELWPGPWLSCDLAVIELWPRRDLAVT